MAESSDSGDIERWHRRFAIECNNRAWELAVATPSSERDRELIDVAHASAYHWGIAGSPLNHMRACMLLAEAHALVGFGESALRYAEEMRPFFLSNDTPDWELAFTHTIFAHAAFVAGDIEAYRRAYADALRAAVSDR